MEGSPRSRWGCRERWGVVRLVVVVFVVVFISVVVKEVGFDSGFAWFLGCCEELGGHACVVRRSEEVVGVWKGGRSGTVGWC